MGGSDINKVLQAGLAPRALDDMSAGGALYSALTACAALRAAGVPPGGRVRRARVLLLGLGGVGQAALQLLVHSGAEVENIFDQFEIRAVTNGRKLLCFVYFGHR